MSESLIPENLKSNGGKFLKGESFDGIGQKLIIRGFEVFVPEKKEGKEDFSAKADNWLVKEGKIKEGESIRYTFETTEEPIEEKVFETTSPGFFIAFSNLDPKNGDIVQISRKGKASATRYTAIRITS